MESNFRNTLIIISAIVIAAIFIHGYWTIRKQKIKDDPVKPKSNDFENSDFDSSGFDNVGVGKPKVVGQNPLHNETVMKSHSLNDEKEFHTDQPMPESVPPAEFEDKEPDLNFGALDNETEEIPEHINQQAGSDFSDKESDYANAEINEVVEEQEAELDAPVPTPVYQQPVTHAKPQVTPELRKKSVRRQTKSSLKRNQMEINFNDAAIEDMPSMSASKTIDTAPTVDSKSAIHPKSTEHAKAKINIEPQVIVLSVVMPKDQDMSGAALLPTLLTLGLKYGEMNIFHRHQDNAGNGKVTFSLANMMNPGTFDLDDMENFTTQGITLFMTLPNTGDAFEVFEQMLNAAKQLAVEFKAQLLDDKRSVMTKQTEQHYKNMIREFERKSRIGSL